MQRIEREFMIVLPIQVSANQFDLLVCLEDENLVRLQTYDPGEVRFELLPEKWHRLQLRTVQIGYLNPEDLKEGMSRAMAEPNMKWLIQKMFSGWKFKPESGDSDEPYQRPLTQ